MKAKGAEVVEFYEGKETPVLSEDTKLLILGMSSSEELAKDEIRLAEEAVKRRIEVIYVADTFGVWNRTWFKDVIIECEEWANIFVISEIEVISTKETYPNAKVTATGNPCWDGFFFPNNTRETVRLNLGLGLQDKVMLCTWGKSKEVNILHGQKAIEVANKVGIQQVLISPHPGDTTPLEDYYGSISGRSSIPVRFITKDQMSSSNLLPGVDLVFESASTTGIEAVCQRIPVVDWFSDIALERLKKATGSDRWPLCEQRASLLYSGDEDNNAIKNMIDRVGPEHDYKYGTESYQDLLERLYPKPARLGVALEKMMDQIEKISILSH